MGSNWNGVGTSKNGFGFYHRVLLLLLALISNGDVSLTIRLFEQTIEKWYTTLPTVLFQVFSSSKAEVFGCAFVSQSLLAHKYSIENTGKSGDKLYINRAILRTRQPIV